LTNRVLVTAVAEIEQGLVDAMLGAGLVKKRLRLAGRGRRGGARALVVTNRRGRCIFVYGFSKNERSNITAKELMALQELSKDLLALSEEEIDAQTKSGALEEITSPRVDDQ
jgi:hypothetical protein